MGLSIVAGVVYLILLVSKATLAWRYVRRYPTPAVGDDDSAVTVAQAILSGDPLLESVLDSALGALPGARFLWLVDTDDAEAQRVTEELTRRHPGRAITRLLVPPPPDGVNPKLHKLAVAQQHAEPGIFVVLDDDTCLPAEGLRALIDGLRTDALVTGLPCYRDDGAFPSRLLAQFVNNQAAQTYLSLAGLVPAPSINGMCYALRSEVLERVGGFAPLKAHLTDDLAVACQVRDAGGRIRQTPYPQFVQTRVRDLRHYIALMHRWFLFALLLLRRQPLALRGGIAILHGLPPLLLWLMIGSAGGVRPPGARLPPYWPHAPRAWSRCSA
ncbi:glycosyltransferase [Tahibacter amnicola]|uniref:Glycosyltransferase n=1 Tax=Tahibacter amnicola TaxID=2976241 RepID=A0ABY6BES6_9GAMM|nr:glycosyltransferase [Tahibacter amnicola]UXI67121.1 glycosyltransferase [Tahibacter amnicola]